ncbi:MULTISPECIES: succinylglutamate desuccinylase/aspartoacylase family protein [unclassified Ruegeria]|uniref:succinylglutamate desuccinylase/aspartoacylase family protein n=1 Tax=unclassified Ruegeria TaxID=2625375 RepID=UPI001AE386FA|nr:MULTISPECIES: succinylglutamate desuccinylase/aspartoacylase family protein [unclassified Ruegeria]
MRGPFEIGGFRVPPGTRTTLDLPVSVLSDHTPVSMSVHVVHGRRPGPVLFVSAAVHGDEVIGVEIARRLLRAPQLDKLAGTLLVIPIVNAFGFMTHSRYLPDRRDLNRSFPGSEGGSLAGRLAHLFMTEIVERSDLGIDLHSAAIHRTNLPQIRVSPASDVTLEYADAFGAPVVMISKLRDGSLRKAAQERGVDILLFEGGEGLRFDELSARAGVAGILRVMNAKGMVAKRGIAAVREKPVHVRSSSWMRAPAGGLLRTFKATGEYVASGDLLGRISDPFGELRTDIICETTGIIVGRTNLPVVHEGDALFHIAETTGSDVEMRVDTIASQLDGDPMFDEDEII